MTAVSIFPILIYLTNFYSINVASLGGDSLTMASFAGKKVLIVNTASNSQFADQYGKLEELYQQYKDSLVIIAFPSNSFGNEPGTPGSIRDSVNLKYNIHFLMGEESVVTGDDISPIYQWLTSSVNNGSMSRPVLKDFQKYLIDSNGNLVAMFAAEVDPMSDDIQNLIK